MLPPLFYYDLGMGDPLMLVHGSFSTGEATWSAQMRTLAAYHRLLVVDRRGHGASPREPRPYTICSDAQDILSAADLAGAAEFHLAGHSYGGLVAIEVARQAPQRVRSLHLIEPPYLALLPDDPDVRELNRCGRLIFAQAGCREPEQTAAAFFEMLLGPAGLAALRARRAWPAIVAEAERAAYEEFAGEYPAGALAVLERTGPVQIYTGGRSHPGLRALARRLAELIPGARLLEVPDADHAVQRWSEPFDAALLAVTRDA
jgi:pimeloyl-ACP methyl ester carboxylesterase